jgi:poly(hydroxyalkanoate) granule-associated protein
MAPKPLAQVPTEVLDAAQRIWFAGLGAMALAQEEGTRLAGHTGQLFSKLVEKGESMEKDGMSPVARLKDAASGAENTWTKVQALLDAQVIAALHRLGVPTQEEIAELTASIENLRARQA